MTDSLLVEILTEELPPKALARLMEAFSHEVHLGLKEKNFLTGQSLSTPFATPRRLAVLISHVLPKQADRQMERKGPAVNGALNDRGEPTPALLGFAKSCGVDVKKLERATGEKGEYFVHRAMQKGEGLKTHLSGIVAHALKKLPMPKVMRWGAGEAQFVRPVHGVVMLHGTRLVPGEVMNLAAGTQTRGHRFLGAGVVRLKNAKGYEAVLKKGGFVLASFEARREAIVKSLDDAAKRSGAGVRWDLGKAADLVDEVTSLVEYPVVLAGEFDSAFLQVPKECLVTSMQQHQKYFPLADKTGKLLPAFLFVSNNKTANPGFIVHGNQRVLTARLSDAKFFYDQDRRIKLAERVARLKNVVYHNKLGTQYERLERLQKSAGEIARRLQADVAQAERAAFLSKADLTTDMVGEFPELQGTMGGYYARHDGESAEVAQAIEQHYFPKAAGGQLPQSKVALAVALADKIDSMVGIFGIGLQPTGEKDPFGLRRAALGGVRILVEKALPLDVLDLLKTAHSTFTTVSIKDSVADELYGFMLERLKPYLREKGFEPDEIDAVLSLKPTRFDQVLPRLQALQAFRELPQGQALAAANKRIVNILRQASEMNAGYTTYIAPDESLKLEQAEIDLGNKFLSVRTMVRAESSLNSDFMLGLKRLAQLGPAVDLFFEKVMVMVEDKPLRAHRLSLLAGIRESFLQIADISKLQS